MSTPIDPVLTAAAAAQLRLVREAQGVQLFSLDRELRYTSFNAGHARAVGRLWGGSIELGVFLLELIPSGEERGRLRRGLERALSGEEFDLVEELGDHGLERRAYEGRCGPTRGEDGAIEGVSVYLRERGFLVVERRPDDDRIALPAPTRSGVPVPIAEERGARLRILVSEDEQTVRDQVERGLVAAGHRVVLTCDGRAAVDRFLADPEGFDLLLLDVTTPAISGVEAMGEVRASGGVGACVPVVLMSANPSDGVFLPTGASFLPKPFDPGTLLDAVRGALEALR